MDADRRACCDPDVAAHYGIGAAEVTGAERCSLILRTRLWFSIEYAKLESWARAQNQKPQPQSKLL